jgi:hypothetical protein
MGRKTDRLLVAIGRLIAQTELHAAIYDTP